MGVVFDVGANDGSDSWRLADTFKVPVHAFEPAPEMLAILAGVPLVTVVPMAVSDFDGEATFHIDHEGDQGRSSLFEYAEGIESYWYGRYLNMSEHLTVPVTRLDTYMAANGIQEVEFLHIDAQGADLAVLRGLGEMASCVKAGKIEAATSRTVALYRDQPLVGDVEVWLVVHGFRIVGYQSNDPAGNEVNLSFTRL